MKRGIIFLIGLLTFVSCDKGENGNFYLDVALLPENITEEVRIVYFVPLNTDNFDGSQTWPNRIGETTVILRPATAQ